MQYATESTSSTTADHSGSDVSAVNGTSSYIHLPSVNDEDECSGEDSLDVSTTESTGSHNSDSPGVVRTTTSSGRIRQPCNLVV